ncbi:MAG: hypothetical protein A2X94_00095 [Bdellovibrionales bacterium GWB1_55_8]|nr:MAG: hypothetical protein A2X94_00095 [Bdellovibrionales bacterium GWB1_55_8]
MSSRIGFYISALSLTFTLAGAVSARSVLAADANDAKAEKVNVDSIREKYWARGNESELGVVQNRLYSKERKIELGLFGGMLTSDPFLTVRSTGFSAGFHFSEYLSAHLLWWRAYWSPSAALNTFQEKMGATTNFNAPLYFYGAEGNASLLYGKLSLIGKAIIYYDMHLTGGLGVTGTESGKYITPLFGLGQKIYLSQGSSLRLDYRVMPFSEEILEKVVTNQLGTSKGFRTNWTHAVSLGVTFLFSTGGSQ